MTALEKEKVPAKALEMVPVRVLEMEMVPVPVKAPVRALVKVLVLERGWRSHLKLEYLPVRLLVLQKLDFSVCSPFN